MLATLLYFVLGALLGFVLIRASRSTLPIEEQVLWGIPVGIMLLSFWTFMWTVIVHVQDWAVIGSVATVAGYVFYHFNLDAFRHQLANDIRGIKSRLTVKEVIPWLIVLLPWLIYSIVTIPYLLYYREGNLVAGWINVWGDWAVHLRNSTFFASQDNLSLENPLYSGMQFHYPYLSSYLSAVLQRFGLALHQSLTWPTFVLFSTLPGLLYSFGRRATGSKLAGILFSYFVMLDGGMGIYYLIKDLFQGHYFWQASAYAPQLYTDVRDNGGYSNHGIWFMNFIMSEFIPQRAFLSGIPIALFVLDTAWQEISQITQGIRVTSKKIWQNATQRLWFAGLLFGTLPLFHTHSFIALGVLIPVAILCLAINAVVKDKHHTVKEIILAYWRYALPILLPATLLGFSLLAIFVFDLKGTGSFIHPITWWMPNQDKTLDNPLFYWLRNAGPLIILGILGSVWSGKQFRPFVIGGLLIFIVTNFVSFQPWHYDNLKIMTYWYIVWCLPAALFIAKLPRPLVIIQIALILLMTGAGLADAISVPVSAHSGGIQLSSSEDLAYAAAVKARTASDQRGLFIAAINHDNPLSVSSGRRLYLGYDGWLWSYGISGSVRLAEVEEMYRATDKGLQLIKDRGINYISVGPQERDRYKPNEAKLRSLFPVLVDFGSYVLLRVPSNFNPTASPNGVIPFN